MRSGRNAEAGVCVLAGGEARRFPGKLERIINGTPLLRHVLASCVRPGPVYVSVARGKAQQTARDFADLHNLRFVEDAEDIAGPLGAIVSVFRGAGEPLIFVIAADCPNVSRDVCEAMLDSKTARDDAVVAQSSRGLEPLIALYDRRAFLRVYEGLPQGRRAVRDVVALLSVKTHRVSDDVAYNINTPTDYAHFLRRRVPA